MNDFYGEVDKWVDWQKKIALKRFQTG